MKVMNLRQEKVNIRDRLIELKKRLKQIHTDIDKTQRKKAFKIFAIGKNDFPEKNLEIRIKEIEPKVTLQKSIVKVFIISGNYIVLTQGHS